MKFAGYERRRINAAFSPIHRAQLTARRLHDVVAKSGCSVNGLLRENG
jgi:hypothetical protein